jgi:hypothetical protein
MAHRVMGATLAISGEFQAARSHLDQAVALYVPEEHKSLATRFGQDIGVAALIYRSSVLYRLGYPESAIRDGDEALRFARDLGQVGTLGYAVGVGAVTEVLCSRFRVAEERVAELSELSEKYGLPVLKAFGALLRGCIFAATDRGAQALPLIASGISALAAAQLTIYAPLGYT